MSFSTTSCGVTDSMVLICFYYERGLGLSEILEFVLLGEANSDHSIVLYWNGDVLYGRLSDSLRFLCVSPT